jgi:hypothetical protein
VSLKRRMERLTHRATEFEVWREVLESGVRERRFTLDRDGVVVTLTADELAARPVPPGWGRIVVTYLDTPSPSWSSRE